ncbi:hypothetical protein ABH931_007415 [Streptacidiphilus sp. MAP12-33]|uniref:hypothetical protein n=1 Tax=Streptacidiphilus sp. MAP12-33 TaxID=3156266 RepID=UPI00351862F7
MEEDTVPGITMLLPQPPTTVTAATLYALAGIVVCLTVNLPLPQRYAHARGDRFVAEPVRAILAAATVVVCTALWPAALLRLLWTTIRGWCARRASTRAHQRTRAHAPRTALRTVMRSDDETMELPVYLEQPASFQSEPTRYENTDWTKAAAGRVVEAVQQRRLLDAAWAARSLVWDVEFAFGPNSSQLWHATELLAHVCHEIGDDVRASQLYARAATGLARNFGAGHSSARAAFDRATALWAKARAADTTDPVTALLVASVTRLFVQAGVTRLMEAPRATGRAASR